jgi:hypothetical protein
MRLQSDDLSHHESIGEGRYQHLPQRLAHATLQRSPLMASPLQVLVRLRAPNQDTTRLKPLDLEYLPTSRKVDTCAQILATHLHDFATILAPSDDCGLVEDSRKATYRKN